MADGCLGFKLARKSNLPGASANLAGTSGFGLVIGKAESIGLYSGLGLFTFGIIGLCNSFGALMFSGRVLTLGEVILGEAILGVVTLGVMLGLGRPSPTGFAVVPGAEVLISPPILT